MNNLIISELTGAEKRNVKQLIKKMKKEKENTSEQQKRQEEIEEYKNKIIKNKEKRAKCFDENRQRKIKDQVFEKLMKEYEKEGYELELKMTIAEKEITKESFYLRRINCLLLILGFLDGVEKMVMKDASGNNRLVSLEDMYTIFLTFLLDEETETLEKEHKILQLYMLINSIKENPLEESHPFYLSEDEKVQTYSKILEVEAKRKKIVEEPLLNNSIPFQNICISDFFNANIEEVYSHIFEEQQQERKNLLS